MCVSRDKEPEQHGWTCWQGGDGGHGGKLKGQVNGSPLS